MTGYYRKVCDDFFIVAETLTNLFKKGTKFVLSEKCEQAFERLKFGLKIVPDFTVPNPSNKPLMLMIIRGRACTPLGR